MADMNVQTTNSSGLSPEVQTFYDKNLIKNTKPVCVYAKYGQKRPIPKKEGQRIEFHRMLPFPKALKPLTEGVTPDGRNIGMTKFYAMPHQYGDYVTMSDVIDVTAVDNLVTEVQENQGNQAGETLDYLTGLALCAGTGVQYAGSKASRNLLTASDKLTCAELLKARTTLVNNKAARIEGHYIAIAHPYVCHDVMQDDAWVQVNQYSKDGKNIYEGTVGGIYGIKLVEDPNAIVFNAEKLIAAADVLTVSNIEGDVITVDEAISASEAAALAGKRVVLNGIVYTITAAAAGNAGSATITLNEVPEDVDADDIISGFGGGANGIPVYPTLVFGANAYGVTEIEGLGLQSIVKPKGSGGTSDPLDQRSTVGWKATHCAEILVQEFITRIETSSSVQA